jgi:putative nucleotidyltransferase with HDIG domain
MISEPQAVTLLIKYSLNESRIKHSLAVADYAFDLASKIKDRHPEIAVSPQKVKIAALLHDIGRSRKGDHEPNTIEILKSEGLEEIAAITMHGTYYEIMQLRGIDNPLFKPQTIENKIVAYADARIKNQIVSMEERWEEIELRRKDECEKIASLRMAKNRFFSIESELMELIK